MASILTPSEIVEIGDVSTYLSANYVAKGALFGGTVIKPIPPVQLAFVTDALRFGLDGGAQTDASIRSTSNYLYWLCGKFQLEAQQIINGGGGGSVIPPSPISLLVNPLDWEVGATASGIAPLADGESSVTLDGSGGMPDLRGYNINFSRGGVTQNTTSLGDGSTYYYWNRVTGLFQLFGGAAQLGELFRIMPDATGGTSEGDSNAPQTIYIDTDGTYTLAEGYMIWKITIKPTSADTVRIGTTLNGEEIMMDKVMTPNVYTNNGVTADVEADGSSQTIYFTGFTTQAQINIYLLPI